jgi:hypothetical protein
MKPRTQFGRISKPTQVHPAANSGGAMALNYDREERAAIHEFDGGCTRAEAEARAAAECQHCGHVAELGTVFKADYGYNLDVCAACAGELKSKGWTDAVVNV